MRTRRQCSGVSSKRFCSGPRDILSDITSSSRSGSMGGLVTCAKCCLKYENRSCGFSERTARGVSVPIEPSGSLPFWAIGERRIAQVLHRVPESELPLEEGGGLRAPVGRRLGQLVQVDLTLLQPLPVRLAHEERPLDLLVVQELVALRVHDEHLARLQPPPLDHVLGRHPQRPVLGRHDHPAVPRHRVAGRPQAVAVERRADDAPVGEGHGRRAVPRLHEGAVVLVERPAVLGPSGRRSPRPRASSSRPRAAGCARRGAGAPGRCRRRPSRSGPAG